MLSNWFFTEIEGEDMDNIYLEQHVHICPVQLMSQSIFCVQSSKIEWIGLHRATIWRHWTILETLFDFMAEILVAIAEIRP